MIPSKKARAIISQFYVAKALPKFPARTLKFILNNREYFPTITDSMIEQIKIEYSINQDDIDKQPLITFAELDAEEREFNNLREKAQEIRIKRSDEKPFRDFGR